MCNNRVMEKPVFDSSKIVKDNALLKIRPDLFDEWDFEKNDEIGLDIYSMSYGANKKVWWICNNGHSWNATINSRTSTYRTNCPYCSGRKATTENNLLVLFPEICKSWDYDKNTTTPEQYTPYSSKKVWWKCDTCKSSYETNISTRTLGHGCTYCRGLKANETNSLEALRPDLLEYWDYSKNKIKPNEVTLGSAKKVWWLCPDCGSSYDMTVVNKVGGQQCSYCSSRKVNHTNSLLTKNPEISSQWHPSKNGDLTPNDVLPNSSKKVWWICKNGHEWNSTIKGRNNGAGCPICYKFCDTDDNSLSTNRPDIASEWHPTLNGDLTPYNVKVNSGRKVWWKCEHGHEWEAIISSRTRENGNNCPICSNQIILIGYNDMWTINSNLASLLANPEDGYSCSEGSNKKLNWKCPDCNEVVKNKSPNDIKNKGLSCKTCGDGMSYPEKFIYTLLNKLQIEFIYDNSFTWSNRKRYDFYIPIFNLIIESHGKQHYGENGFHTLGNKKFEDELANDKHKKELALKNGIMKYIEIDCRLSDFHYIKNNIIDSELNSILDLDNFNFDNLEIKENNSLVIKAWDLWNSGIHSTEEISKILNIATTTVRRYLDNGSKLGKCDYDPAKRYERASKSVVQLSLEGDFIKRFNSLTEAANSVNLQSTIHISQCCRDYNKTSKGFRWMYEIEYTDILMNNKEMPILKVKTRTRRKPIKKVNNINVRKVVQLDLNYNLIQIFDSVKEASELVGIKKEANIYRACKETNRTVKGFKWLYLDEYERLIKKESLKINNV